MSNRILSSIIEWVDQFSKWVDQDKKNAPQNFNNVQLLSITFWQFASKNYILKCGNVAQFFIAQFISS